MQNKCAKYWPEQDEPRRFDFYGGATVTVSLMNSTKSEDFEMRQLRLVRTEIDVSCCSGYC